MSYYIVKVSVIYLMINISYWINITFIIHLKVILNNIRTGVLAWSDGFQLQVRFASLVRQRQNKIQPRQTAPARGDEFQDFELQRDGESAADKNTGTKENWNIRSGQLLLRFLKEVSGLNNLVFIFVLLLVVSWVH